MGERVCLELIYFHHPGTSLSLGRDKNLVLSNVDNVMIAITSSKKSIVLRAYNVSNPKNWSTLFKKKKW